MARGWESKAIESQQDDAERVASARPALSAEEREQVQRRATLGLAIARAQADLQMACHPAHRDMLHLKLQALQAELGRM